jgi:hypothetical protein
VALTTLIVTALPALLAAAIGVAIAQRRLVTKLMPDCVERWRALSAGDRLRIHWAIARGTAVGDARLATLAVAFARMRGALWAQLSVTKYAMFGIVGAAFVVVSVVTLGGDDGAAYGGAIALAMLVEALSAPGRGARLARAEQRNQRLAATT